MEHLNSVHLRGIVGVARVQQIGDTELCRFSLATEFVYRMTKDETICETSWFQCTAFKSDKMPDFATILKAATVEVKGRLRNNRYTDSNGMERTITEVIASEVKVIAPPFSEQE